MKTAVAAADKPRPEMICEERHPNYHLNGRALRCWKRNGHDGDCMTVRPNGDAAVLQRPQVAYW